MSPTPLSLSPDLVKLQQEGYDISIVGVHIVIQDVPYVDSTCEVKRGALVSELTMAGNRTHKPSTHVAMFSGDHPCDRHGNRLTGIAHHSQRQELGHGLTVDHSFSSKPPGGYVDYHHKLSTYLNLIVGPAQAIDPAATAQTFPVLEAAAGDGPFAYIDTASSRVGIEALNERFRGQRVAIIGVGGTGSYIVDFVAKTPVAEIHLWDRDLFLQHNAFRAPGAPSRAELETTPNKAEYFARIYSQMHTGIVAHAEFIDESNVHLLNDMDFVFIASGDGSAKKLITNHVIHHHIAFVDVGLGLYEADGTIGGSARVTTATPGYHAHLATRIPSVDLDADAAYESNIQIADMNALNAALAVGRWKRHLGFYRDLEAEHHSIYDIDGNNITNADTE